MKQERPKKPAPPPKKPNSQHDINIPNKPDSINGTMQKSAFPLLMKIALVAITIIGLLFMIQWYDKSKAHKEKGQGKTGNYRTTGQNERVEHGLSNEKKSNTAPSSSFKKEIGSLEDQISSHYKKIPDMSVYKRIDEASFLCGQILAIIARQINANAEMAQEVNELEDLNSLIREHGVPPYYMNRISIQNELNLKLLYHIAKGLDKTQEYGQEILNIGRSISALPKDEIQVQKKTARLSLKLILIIKKLLTGNDNSAVLSKNRKIEGIIKNIENHKNQIFRQSRFIANYLDKENKYSSKIKKIQSSHENMIDKAPDLFHKIAIHAEYTLELYSIMAHLIPTYDY